MITLRSAIFGSATETRPIGSDSSSRRFCPVSSARFFTAPTSRSMRIAGGLVACSGAASVGTVIDNERQERCGSQQPATTSLSLLSAVEVALLEAVTAQDLDGVLLRLPRR